MRSIPVCKLNYGVYSAINEAITPVVLRDSHWLGLPRNTLQERCFNHIYDFGGRNYEKLHPGLQQAYNQHISTLPETHLRRLPVSAQFIKFVDTVLGMNAQFTHIEPQRIFLLIVSYCVAAYHYPVPVTCFNGYLWYRICTLFDQQYGTGFSWKDDTTTTEDDDDDYYHDDDDEADDNQDNDDFQQLFNDEDDKNVQIDLICSQMMMIPSSQHLLADWKNRFFHRQFYWDNNSFYLHRFPELWHDDDYKTKPEYSPEPQSPNDSVYVDIAFAAVKRSLPSSLSWPIQVCTEIKRFTDCNKYHVIHS